MSSDVGQVSGRSGGRGPRDPEREVRRRRRRYAIRALVQACVVTTVTICAYFTLPFTTSRLAPSLVLLAGTAVVTALLAWQIHQVVQSPYPRVRTIAALTTALPLFLIVFAMTYYVSSLSAPGAYSEPLSRLDALYFAVTVFSTVGFGDIVPLTGLARILTMAQMIGDVIVVGLVVRVMVAAMRRGIARQGSDGFES